MTVKITVRMYWKYISSLFSWPNYIFKTVNSFLLSVRIEHQVGDK